LPDVSEQAAGTLPLARHHSIGMSDRDRWLPSRSALEGERKQVTVLLADLKDSMALLAERDPEEVRQSLAPGLERSRLACFAPSVGASVARRGVGKASSSAGEGQQSRCAPSVEKAV